MKPRRTARVASSTASRARAPRRDPAPGRELTVEALARAANTTVRNVRAYQDRGLLPPPERRGRAAVYRESHLARVRLINQLLARGYALANIAELLDAWERGHDVAELLGLESILTSPFETEPASHVSLADVAIAFGKTADGDSLRRAVEIGLLVPDGGRFRVPSPRLYRAGLELVAAGVPVPAVLDELARLRADLERVATRMVTLVAEHVLPESGARLPSAREVPQLAALVRRLRPLARVVVDGELARALERAVGDALGERLGKILEKL